MPDFVSRISKHLLRCSYGLALGASLALVAPASPGWAQANETPPPAPAEAPLVVGRVSVTGNTFTDSVRILRTFEVPTGARFSTDMVRRGTRKLIALGLFSDIKVDRSIHDGTIDLVIMVTERPRLKSIHFIGNKKREEVDLEKKLFIKAGETFSNTQTQTQVDTLLKYYREEGFARAKVIPRADTLAASNEVDLTFVVEEGEKVRITDIEFTGRSAVSEKILRKAMKTKAKGFFGGGDLKDETFPEDREKLEAWYHDHGYRDARVLGFELRPGVTPQQLTLIIGLEEGRRYRLGEMRWDGNQVVPSTVLDRLSKRKPGALYDKGGIEKTEGSAYGEYAEHGYLYVRVDAAETVRQDSLVDVVYHVTEGSPSHVRLISIVGNKGTREKVIRREIDIHEGDRFRRSALVRSQGDIMRLGIFEEAIPDFAPAESTDVDLVFRVKEKQVGTASAGAGFTNESGLTGILEVGHSNVLGNGQNLALHLERGGKREDYSLSFTEPWFHDSPTLLGFSAYNSFRQLTEYDQRRRGGSARIGRPLPWPDYSRGSLSYTLESLRIDNVRSDVTIGGIKVGQPQLTSTVETNFLRNSTDNPFYPTKGTRLTANDEFTGGILGGDLSYLRHRYEGRIYLPSVLKGITTMTRLRVGSVGQYPWKNGTFPDYTRFRLGGGNTQDPLRGYLDYQVVPSKFVQDVVIGKTIANIDSLTTPGVRDTSYNNITSRRRYPGGRYMALFTFEQQFAIVHPLHGLFFMDAGNTWDLRSDIFPLNLKVGAGFGLRMEIPLLGNVGFDYGYGFQRDDGPKWAGHFLLGNVNF
ncbi:MAG: outer membrane protein assembly factor BamA [Candidatus Eisenbacteria bacterium]